MNDAMIPTALVTTAVFLAAATAITVALVALAARGLREPGTHRTLWRAALATIFTLFVGEATGLFAAGGAWMRYQLASPKRRADVVPLPLIAAVTRRD